MHVSYRNVNDSFAGLVYGFANPRESQQQWTGTADKPHIPVARRSSRNGDVLMIEEPVTITYRQPRERVLLNQARDANPFFHLYESLWILAGRNDVEPLAYYANNIRNYSDDGKTFNGAYGYRWRHKSWWDKNQQTPGDPWIETTDQLTLLIDHLKAKPDSRRAVLQMWNVEDDLLKIDSSKDVCCNLSALFSIRTELSNHPDAGQTHSAFSKYLDMTVFNRSNDLIWGMLGANVVHFSVLQEYVAAHLGVSVGVYNQVSNNLHVYLNEHWKPDAFAKWQNEECNVDYESEPKMMPLVKDPAVFDKEVCEFVEQHKDGNDWHDGWQEPFLNEVAQPMLTAFHYHKVREYANALDSCAAIEADDWRYVATKWIEKRKANWEKKQNAES